MTGLISAGLMGIALSMDAFSLAILYGTLSLSKTNMLLLSITVGIFHFLMPILGYSFGKVLFQIIMINPHVLIGVIFCFIAAQMFMSLTKEDEMISATGFSSLLIFAFTVSIDSFSVGIGLSGLNNSIYISALIFAILSCIFTMTGLILGGKINKRFGNVSTLVGSIILFILGVYYFFN